MAVGPKSKTHQAIQSRRTPPSLGAGPQALLADLPDKMLFISQQLPFVTAGRLVGPDFNKQAETVLNNLINLVKDGGFAPTELAQIRIYLTDIKNEKTLYPIMHKYFAPGSFPAISIIGVAALPAEAQIAIEALAIKPTEDKY